MVKKHGYSRSKNPIKIKVYRAWCHMKDRCLNSNCVEYHNYGGRGIKVYLKWQKSFKSFLDDMGEPESLDLSLDRIDNDGDYTPDNCRWATKEEQSLNRRKYDRRKYKAEGVLGEVHKLRSEGLSTRRIAKQLNIGKTLVWKIINGYE